MEKDEDSLDDSIADLEEELELEEDEDSRDDSKVKGEENLEMEKDEDSLDDSIADLEEELELGEKAEEEVEAEEEIIYECPVCEGDLAEDAEECPHCGVVFEEEEKETGKKKEIKKRFNSSMEKVNSKLSVFDDEPVPKDHFEQLKEEAKSLADEGRYKEGIDKLKEALEFGDELEEISGRLGELNKKIQIRKKKSLDYEDFEKKIRKAKEFTREGKADKALSTIDETLQKIERKKEEEKQKVKKRINQTVQDLNEILEVAKKFDVALGKIRDIISKSLELSREGKVDKALEVLEEARDKSSAILREEIDNDISNLEKKKDSLFDDEKKEKLEQKLEDASKANEQDKFGEAYDHISRCRNMTAESRLKIGSMSVTKIIKIKELSEDIGLDCSEEEELIDEAKREHKNGNVRRSKSSLQKAKENLLKRVPQEVQRVMKEGMKELEKAKKRGEDISKPVSYLKKSNLMIKKKKFVDALEYVKKFTDSLEQISEEKGKAAATVGRVEKKTRHRTEKRTTSPSREASSEVSSKSAHKERGQTNDKSSISSSVTEDKAVEFDLDEFYEGSTNLLKVKDLSKAYNVFKELVEKRNVGVCVTREYPDKVKKKYDLQKFFGEESTNKSSGVSNEEERDVSMIWLSNVGEKDAVQPKDLEKLSFKLESFITRGVGVILLNGFEFLVSNNNFKTVLHLIQSLKDQVAMGGSILLITVSPDSFDQSQLDQLEREVDEVF